MIIFFYSLLILCHLISLYFGYFFLAEITQKALNSDEPNIPITITILCLIEVCFALSTAKALQQIIANKWQEISTYNYIFGLLILGSISAYLSVQGVSKTPYFRPNFNKTQVSITPPDTLPTQGIKQEYISKREAIDKGFLAITIEQISQKQTAKLALFAEESQVISAIDSTNRANQTAYLAKVAKIESIQEGRDNTDKQEATFIAGFVLAITAFLQWFLAYEKNIKKTSKNLKEPKTQTNSNQNQTSENFAPEPIDQDYEQWKEANETANQILCQTKGLAKFKLVIVDILTTTQNAVANQKDWEKEGIPKSRYYEIKRRITEYKETPPTNKMKIA